MLWSTKVEAVIRWRLANLLNYFTNLGCRDAQRRLSAPALSTHIVGKLAGGCRSAPCGPGYSLYESDRLTLPPSCSPDRAGASMTRLRTHMQDKQCEISMWRRHNLAGRHSTLLIMIMSCEHSIRSLGNLMRICLKCAVRLAAQIGVSVQ